jgi:Zn ribbon nucleic-acid-binding protein
MEIFGLKCSACGVGQLKTVNFTNGTIHTICLGCGYESRPNPKQFKANNQVFSRFANKSVEVQYSRQASKSGTFPKADNNVISAGLRKCK